MNIKEVVFYIIMVIIIFSGEFLMNSGLKTGQPPVIYQQTLSGKDVMDNLSKGPAIIYFWAEWCGVCKMMQQAVSGVVVNYPVMTVAVKSGSVNTVQEYLHDENLHWEVVNDPLGEIAEEYQARGVPSIFFLDKKGEIVLTSTGYTSEMGLRLRLWLVSLF